MSKPEKAAAYTTALIVLVFISIGLNYGMMGIGMFVILLFAAIVVLVLIGMLFWVLSEAYKEYFK